MEPPKDWFTPPNTPEELARAAKRVANNRLRERRKLAGNVDIVDLHMMAVVPRIVPPIVKRHAPDILTVVLPWLEGEAKTPEAKDALQRMVSGANSADILAKLFPPGADEAHGVAGVALIGRMIYLLSVSAGNAQANVRKHCAAADADAKELRAMAARWPSLAAKLGSAADGLERWAGSLREIPQFDRVRTHDGTTSAEERQWRMCALDLHARVRTLTRDEHHLYEAIAALLCAAYPNCVDHMSADRVRHWVMMEAKRRGRQ